MAKIAIDLLPLEFRAEEVKKAKFVKIQTIGVSIILLMVFLSSLTIALRILQTKQISLVQAQLNQSENRINNQKTTQASLVLLKNRLTTINQYLGTDSKQSQMYKLIAKLLPSAVTISSISVSKEGEVVILATAANGEALDALINNLTSANSNQGKIKEVSAETINRGKDGIYRLTFKIMPK